MYKLGIIGYGSMGSMLLNKFIESGVLGADEIILSSTSKEKLRVLSSGYPGLKTCEYSRIVFENAEHILICTNGASLVPVIKDSMSLIGKDTHIITIKGSASIIELEEMTGAQITKVTPTLTFEASSGYSLVIHGESVRKANSDFVENIFRRIGSVMHVKEETRAFAAILSACMPGLLAEIYNELIKSALAFDSGLSEDEVIKLLKQTISGTGQLIGQKGMEMQEIISRVAVKDGYTEQGIKVLEAKLPEAFEDMFQAVINRGKKKQ